VGGRVSLDGPAALPFVDETPGEPAVRGYLHRPAGEAEDSLVLTHGAGSNCQAPLLVAIAAAFASAGLSVLRCDLPYRQASPTGPPPSAAAGDRAGLRRAVLAVRRLAQGRVFLGGHSYGGRQASMLAADDPALADGLLLLSYPLHPSRQPSNLRTAHFPRLRTRALFVHGSRDPLGSIEALRQALALVPAPTALLVLEGRAHDLSRRGPGRATPADVADEVVPAFLALVRSARTGADAPD